MRCATASDVIAEIAIAGADTFEFISWLASSKRATSGQTVPVPMVINPPTAFCTLRNIITLPVCHFVHNSLF